jgi:hypothetical protein
MIHIENALLTLGAMMAPLWLEVVTHQAEFSLKDIPVVERPVKRYSTRIRKGHGQIAPKGEKEENSDKDRTY